ncbi:TfoX/Sxy family protein [Tahibacter amnicola]|uniref:TfoX/Sxy family protein n=1 Tax=Tahibacter amnicola TaxID=2976241 RepID=A0ABY6BF50_9GAMM|nr:TfoX/Sxy family protein [Tahibacter amnicola]UXI68663.1 TfoX/Sxy family protein [Tahibacter amnicola]
MASTDKIRNVGPKSAAWLRQVGVRTLEDLRRVGPIEAFMKVKRAGFRPSLNLLYAMQGALDDCHWADLPEATKQGLVTAAEAAETANPIKNRWDKAAARSAQRDGSGVESGGEDSPAREESDGFGDGDSGVREITGTSRDFD